MHLRHPLVYQRIVSGIYAAWCADYLFAGIGLMLGLKLPFSSDWIFYPFYHSMIPLWLAFGFDVVPRSGMVGAAIALVWFFGFLALFVLYPIASYYLWRNNRVGWIVAFILSLATVALDIYFILTDSPYPLLISGVVVNLSIVCLLWVSNSLQAYQFLHIKRPWR